MKQFLVQKFGGTSVGNPERLLSLNAIVRSYLAQYTPILVVSAVSGYTKEEGTTSLLLSAADKACSQLDYREDLLKIKLQHERLLGALQTDTSKNAFLDILNAELHSLDSFLLALTKIGEKSPKTIDFIISIGERLSANLVANSLVSNGINAKFCDLSQVYESDTDGDYQQRVLYDQLSESMIKYIEPNVDQVVVATGFFGSLPQGILSQVGRGYSDLTAALIARGLGNSKVKELQIWKEVDGVFSADPRKVGSAKVLSELSANEAVELTFFGSEVIHPHTMEQVISKDIPIRVLNSLKPDAPGTLIKKDLTLSKDAKAVTVKKGATVLSLTSNRMFDAKGFLAQLFEVLKDEDLVVDLVSTSEVNVSCTVNDLAKLNRAIPKLEKLGEIKILDNRAILAVVGNELGSESNTIARIFSALSTRSIYPEMVTQAESRTSISCVIKESEMSDALIAVHSALFEV